MAPKKKKGIDESHPLYYFVTKFRAFSHVMQTCMFTFLMFCLVVLFVFGAKLEHWVAVTFFVGTVWLLARPRPLKQAKPRKKPAKVLVVLGSGGHTTEMMYALSALEWGSYTPTYCIAKTDEGSEPKAQRLEKRFHREETQVELIPRAREVKQSLITSVYTTIDAFYMSVRAVWNVFPDVVVCNGPGTCVPVVFAAYVFRALLIKRIKVVYSESFTCVSHLSMSGLLLYPFCDAFCVQWPDLLRRYRGAIYTGRIPLSPPTSEATANGAAADTAVPYVPPVDGYVLVTVGSTNFDTLLEAVDTAGFVAAIRRLGFTRLKLQIGTTGKYKPHNIMKHAGPGFEYSYFEYDDNLPRTIAKASLVIGHAGAGSILDALTNGVKMIVVPNTGLMNDHQSELARRLADLKYVYASSVNSLVGTLQQADFATLQPFPAAASPRFGEVLRDLVGPLVVQRN
eukprot:TRINITY_DN41293_c0_g1_i1.p1 TRINITY_DN41293_c0_g1~~TRINITY_DN41293_c0_g1_i1.p1  ORF type:complete len:454 (-),score=70.19 TRINITY_DN41293_c0_g1_i1:11-1372(-)